MSTRALTAALLAAFQAKTVRPAWFYEGQFESAGSPSLDYVRLWSGAAAITWDGKNWLAAGGLLEVGPVAESSEIRAVGFQVSLKGDASLLALNLGYARQGLPGRVWLGAFDTTSGALIVDPFKVFEGRFDVPDIVDAGGTVKITAKYESRFIDLDRVRARRYTDEDQQAEVPGDRGFEYVPALQSKDLAWGRPQVIHVEG